MDTPFRIETCRRSYGLSYEIRRTGEDVIAEVPSMYYARRIVDLLNAQEVLRAMARTA